MDFVAALSAGVVGSNPTEKEQKLVRFHSFIIPPYLHLIDSGFKKGEEALMRYLSQNSDSAFNGTWKVIFSSF